MKTNTSFWFIKLMLLSLFFYSCENENLNDLQNEVSLEMQDEDLINQAKKIPFAVSNMQLSYEKMSKNKTSSLSKAKHLNKNAYIIKTTHEYFKFLPKDSIEYDILVKDSILSVSDLPFESQLSESDTYFQDPSLMASDFTYLYSVVPLNYDLPEGIEATKIADLHFTKEDEIPDNPTESDIELLAVMYDLNLEARKEADDLDTEEKEELKYFPKDGSLNNSITYQEALVLGYNLNDLIIDFSEIEEEEKRRRWTPAGTVTVFEDAINRNVGVMGARVKVRKWGWLVIRKAYTNRNGYFQTSRTRTKNVKYSIFFRNSPNFEIMAGTWFWAARYIDGSNHSRRAWNKNFTGGRVQFYSYVHNGAYDYYNRIANQYNIQKPKSNIRISSRWDECASSQHRPAILALLPTSRIKVTRKTSSCAYRNSDGIYATTVHELAHAGHQRMDAGMFSIFESGSKTRDLLIESWAEGVESIVTNDRYLGLTQNYLATNRFNNTNLRLWNDFRQTQTVLQMNQYTPIVADLIDMVNQNTIPNLPGNQPIDRVNGYTLNQIQNSLNNCRDINCWENKLRNNYNNTTQNNLTELFDYVRAVRNNASNW